ncbi:hypothetical protein HELRODRAFT_166893 [Helobdella robusta]|uniref:Endonuclease/exonuclease/phosphatase domain-containing protein n=1 Tax=Helobdella robusta TaxID=6412 RepID=T1EYQ0_HELRO|nr:hypothetical protein HELRODRAFT_166893 [Helobdella robusta]ESO11833.1 hypothetical protein HELRODRAFT_166893 [Helobdella robusta]
MEPDDYGLKLCEKCRAENCSVLAGLVEGLKDTPKLKDELSEINNNINVLKLLIEDIQKKEFQINTQLDDLKKLSSDVEFLKQSSLSGSAEVEKVRKFSDLFSNKVDNMACDLKTVVCSVAATDGRINLNNERNLRKNNIIIFNITEDSQFSRNKDKEAVLRLLKVLLPDFDFSKEISDWFRLGKKPEINQRPRPVVIKFCDFAVKNLVLENCSKLKGNVEYKKVILSNDLVKEDRNECKKLIEEKKKSLAATEDTNKDINFLSLYRSPGSSDLNNDSLMQLLDEFLELPGLHIFLGDLNFPEIDWNIFCSGGLPSRIDNRFLDFLNDHYLMQHVNEPTRARSSQQPHILDLVVSDIDIIWRKCGSVSYSSYIRFWPVTKLV